MFDKESARNEQITDEVFRATVEMVQSLPQDGDVAISNTDKLEFYALFKQATIGRCNTARPAIWNVVDRYKWDAWKSLNTLEPVQAKDRYVHKFKTIMDQVLKNRTVNELLQDERWAYLRPIIEPRFELINHALNKQPTSSSVSSTSQEDELNVHSSSNSTIPTPLLLHLATKSAIESPSNETAVMSTDDEEYQDAPDDSPVIVNSNDFLQSHGNITPNDPIIPNTIRSDVVEYVQATTQIINQQIQALGRTLKKQNALIQRFIELMSQNRSHTRWPFLLLLFLWPIVVQLAMRYFFQKINN
ncbi:Acyl CoA binding protein [Aphelenchoides besseyi]|nr:Acyl CoA binding protein [Aphelenchoides besseyi]